MFSTMPIEIHHYIKLQYSTESSLWQVYEWSRKFKNGVSCVTDATRPGQPTVLSLQATAEDEHTITENCGIKVEEVATMLDISQY